MPIYKKGLLSHFINPNRQDISTYLAFCLPLFASSSLLVTLYSIRLDLNNVIMKISAVVISAIAQVASAHYFFDSVVLNGAATPSFRYIREFTRPTKYNPIKFSSNPAVDLRDGSTIDGPDARCNQGAFTNAGKTQTLEVAAGNSVTVKLAVGATMQHPGQCLE